MLRAAAGYGHERLSVSREGLLMILFFLRPPGWSAGRPASPPPPKHETHQQVFKMIMADSFFIAQLALRERDGILWLLLVETWWLLCLALSFNLIQYFLVKFIRALSLLRAQFNIKAEKCAITVVDHCNARRAFN
jgi:hypothetical protein